MRVKISLPLPKTPSKNRTCACSHGNSAFEDIVDKRRPCWSCSRDPTSLASRRQGSELYLTRLVVVFGIVIIRVLRVNCLGAMHLVIFQERCFGISILSSVALIATLLAVFTSTVKCIRYLHL